MALPHHLQLHGRLSARYRGHQGDPGGQAGPPDQQVLIRLRRSRSAGLAAGTLLAAGTALCGVTAPASAAAAGSTATTATTPPSPTSPAPVPRITLQPDLSVGGPRLASTGLVLDLPAGVPAPPALHDASWLLADMTSGQVIAARAPHVRYLPASTLKTLTALTLLPKVPATRVVTATASDAAADGTRVGMVPGQRYTGRQLFEALLMSSGNDAAYALADAGGGRRATLEAMNANAAELGAHDTVAKDPSGLDAPGQTSSAYDLALIGRAAMQLPDFRRYVTTKQADFPAGKGKSFKINNHNRLLYNYPGTIGIKNGYTIAAHRTFISAVSRGGHTYLLTEMRGTNGSWREQAAVYDWAFRYGTRAKPVGRLVDPGEVTTPPQAPQQAAGPATTATATPQPRRTSEAAAVPQELRTAGAPAWVGFTGLAAALGLVLHVWVRTRRRPSGRHRAAA